MFYYLCFYSDNIISKNRYAAPAANNKCGYVIDALSKISDKNIMVVSMSGCLSNGIEKKGEILKQNVLYKYFFAIKSKIKPLSFLGHIITKFNAYFFLLKKIKTDDVLVVYHSLVLMSMVRLIKKVKHCKLIIEVEELYSDVKKNSSLKVKELNYFKIADSYIFITNLLEKKVNVFHKPYAISHGVYSFNSTVPAKPVNDGKTHIVYAGTLSRIKGGVYNAIKSAMYLDASFVLHILGKGNAQEEADIKLMVESNNRNNCCKVIFDGYLSGDAFNAFIQSCDIGLSSQPANASFNDSSFPSKILTYLSNGIKVVSVDISAVKTSDVGDLITYYTEDSPEEIAKAIKKAATSEKQDPRKRLCELDAKFRNDLKKLIY